jgi:hypothetical protein
MHVSGYGGCPPMETQMVKFVLDSRHEYEDSIHVEIQTEEHIPGNGVQTVIAASFYMTKLQFDSLVEQGDEWFGHASEE